MKKIDKVMNELKENGKLPILDFGKGVVIEHTHKSQLVIVEKFCPENFGLEDSEMCGDGYGCQNCWNEEVEINE